ncbi:hypothetical protein GQ53DRAFT_749782 [Thozetella sp. PMI_491]|nr:hypothetical protein GQ53DRAFT_749782 [Thozetella sp. PMI_491]
MSEGQSSQLQSPTQLSSTGVESGLFTAASVSSTLGSDFGESAAFTNPPFTFDETYDYDLGQNPQE